MSYRRSLLGVIAIAAIGLTGCSGTSASAVPSVAVPSIPASIGTGDLTGFCEDFAGVVSDDWPNIDQTTASELSAVVTEWSTESGAGLGQWRCPDHRHVADDGCPVGHGRQPAAGRRDRLPERVDLRRRELLTLSLDCNPG